MRDKWYTSKEYAKLIGVTYDVLMKRVATHPECFITKKGGVSDQRYFKGIPKFMTDKLNKLNIEIKELTKIRDEYEKKLRFNDS